MQELIADQTNHPGVAGALTSLEQLDSLWQADFPTEDNWRTYKHPRNGWPEGKFQQMSEDTSLLRDTHMCNSIIELVSNGERVFISMGASHAPIVEATLRGMLESAS